MKEPVKCATQDSHKFSYSDSYCLTYQQHPRECKQWYTAVACTISRCSMPFQPFFSPFFLDVYSWTSTKTSEKTNILHLLPILCFLFSCKEKKVRPYVSMFCQKHNRR